MLRPNKTLANKKLAEDYKKSINENCIDFNSLDEAKEYLKVRGFRYQETYSIKNNKHIIYRRNQHLWSVSNWLLFSQYIKNSCLVF